MQPNTATAPTTRQTRRRRGPWIGAAVAVLLAALITVLATAPTADNDTLTSPLIGRQAPTFAGPSLLGGDFDLEAASGQFVIVNFFAPWCTPCRLEHPELIDFSQRHAIAGDAQVVSVLSGTTPDAAVEYFEDEGGTWPLLDDPQGRVALQFGLIRLPETFVISPEGVVIAKLSGAVTSLGLDKILNEATARP